MPHWKEDREKLIGQLKAINRRVNPQIPEAIDRTDNIILQISFLTAAGNDVCLIVTPTKQKDGIGRFTVQEE